MKNDNMNFSETAPIIKTMMIDETSYQYEEGMTWGEWFDSAYNTDSLTLTYQDGPDPYEDYYALESWFDTYYYNGIEWWDQRAANVYEEDLIYPQTYGFGDYWLGAWDGDRHSEPLANEDGYIYYYYGRAIKRCLATERTWEEAMS